MTSRGQCRRGGVLVNVFDAPPPPPPSGNPVSTPVFHLSKFRPPPQPGWLATGLPLVFILTYGGLVRLFGGGTLPSLGDYTG